MMENNEVIGIYVKNIDFFEPDFFLSNPSIDGYLIDKTSGKCTKADSSLSNVYSYVSPFSLKNEEIQYVRSHLKNWNRLLVIDSSFTELNSNSKILFFEICKKGRNNKTKEYEKIRTAWAFLVPLASDGSMNTNQDLKLQLYKIRKDCKISHQDCNIYHLYSEHKLKKTFGVLLVSVKGVILNKSEAVGGEKEEKEEKEKPTISEENVAIKIPSSPLKPETKSYKWSRHPNQSCKIPNTIYMSHNLGKNGVSCLQFSKSGTNLAVAVTSQIHIYNVLSCEEIFILKGHIGLVYEVDWSPDDEYLLSVSSDCRGVVWCLPQTTPMFILPHPTFIYCGKWFGGTDQIVTGGKDHILRYWVKKEDRLDLVEEIPGHPGFISALTTQDRSFVFSGDSQGFVIIRKFTNGKWTEVKQLSFSEIGHSVIDSIHIHYSKRRIVISVRSKGSYLVDVVSGIVLQTYKSVINTFARCISSLTPCGSYLLSFCQNGDVGVWEVNTGKLFATYDNIFPVDRLTELSGYIHYHPHEHMVGIAVLGPNHSLFLLKYDFVKNDSKKLGLSFVEKKKERDTSQTLLTNRKSSYGFLNKTE